MNISRISFAFLLASTLAFGQGAQLPKYTVATLPAASSLPSYTVQVIDGANMGDCSIGGGTNNVLCTSSVGKWVVAGWGTCFPTLGQYNVKCFGAVGDVVPYVYNGVGGGLTFSGTSVTTSAPNFFSPSQTGKTIELPTGTQGISQITSAVTGVTATLPSSFTASINPGAGGSASTLVVTAQTTTGNVSTGETLYGTAPALTPGLQVVQQLTGTAGQTGIYTLNNPVSFTAGTGGISSTTLTVATLNAGSQPIVPGAVNTGMVLNLTGVAGVTITAQLTGTTGGAGTYSVSSAITIPTGTSMTAALPIASEVMTGQGGGSCALTAFNGAGGSGATGNLWIGPGNLVQGIALTNAGTGYTGTSTSATLGACTGGITASGTLAFTSTIAPQYVDTTFTYVSPTSGTLGTSATNSGTNATGYIGTDDTLASQITFAAANGDALFTASLQNDPGTGLPTYLNVTSVPYGTITVGNYIQGLTTLPMAQAMALGTQVLSQIDGTPGGVGHYNVTIQNNVFFTATIAATTMTVTNINLGTGSQFASGQTVYGVSGVSAGTTITGSCSGTSVPFTCPITPSQTVSTATAMSTLNGSATIASQLMYTPMPGQQPVGSVYYPPGTYFQSTIQTFPSNPIVFSPAAAISGAGQGVTVVQQILPSGPVFTVDPLFTNHGQSVPDVTIASIQDMTISGASSFYVSGNDGVDSQNSNNGNIIQRVEITGMGADALHSAGNANSFTWQNLYLHNNRWGWGIYIGKTIFRAAQGTIKDVRNLANQQGLYATSVDNLNISNMNGGDDQYGTSYGPYEYLHLENIDHCTVVGGYGEWNYSSTRLVFLGSNKNCTANMIFSANNPPVSSATPQTHYTVQEMVRIEGNSWNSVSYSNWQVGLDGTRLTGTPTGGIPTGVVVDGANALDSQVKFHADNNVNNPLDDTGATTQTEAQISPAIGSNYLIKSIGANASTGGVQFPAGATFSNIGIIPGDYITNVLPCSLIGTCFSARQPSDIVAELSINGNGTFFAGDGQHSFDTSWGRTAVGQFSVNGVPVTGTDSAEGDCTYATDLTISTSNPYQVTSATIGSWSGNDHWLDVTGGTGWNAQHNSILNVNSTIATLGGVPPTQQASFEGSISGTTLTITGSVTGTIANGQILYSMGSTNLTANTTIVSGSGSSWVVSNSQTVGAENMITGTAAANKGAYMVNRGKPAYVPGTPDVAATCVNTSASATPSLQWVQNSTPSTTLNTPAWLTFFGNGNEGASNVTTSVNLTGEHWYSSFTVSNTGTVTVNSCTGLVIHSTGACIINGTINARGADQSGACFGSAGGAGGGSGGGTAAGTAGSGSLSLAGAVGVTEINGGTLGAASGGNGGNGGNNAHNVENSYTATSGGSDGLYLGGGSGKAGGSTGGAAGLGGVGVTLICGSITGTGTIATSGSAGNPPAANSTGGGSGGGAGPVLLSSIAPVTSWPTVYAGGGAGQFCTQGAGNACTSGIAVPEAVPNGNNSCETDPILTLTGCSGGLSTCACTVSVAGTNCGASPSVTFGILGGGGTQGTGTVNPTWSGGGVASCTLTTGTSASYTSTTYSTNNGAGGQGGYAWWVECAAGTCTIFPQ